MNLLESVVVGLLPLPPAVAAVVAGAGGGLTAPAGSSPSSGLRTEKKTQSYTVCIMLPLLLVYLHSLRSSFCRGDGRSGDSSYSGGW